MTNGLVTLADERPHPLDTQHETAVAAASSQAKAATEARYLVALHRPRNLETVRVRLLDSCRRPGFAATAKYSKPIGGGRVIGASIRFAEEAARCLTNLLIETPTRFDSAEKRVVSVLVTDLESNLSYAGDITLDKVVERKTLRKGQVPLSQRVNSQGEVTYLVEATEDELLTKQGAAVSKHIRNGVLRVLPSDILEEALAQVDATLRNEDARDPAEARRKIVDAFYGLGVSPDQLAEYLGHAIEQMQPAKVMELRTIYAALKDGETTWAAVMEMRDGNGNGYSAKGGASLRDKVAKKAAKEEDAEQVPA